jgi:lysophospholipase L1-like esterase
MSKKEIKNSKLHVPVRYKIIFMLASLVIFVFLAEGVLRLVGPDLYYKNQFFPLNRDIDFSEVYKKDSELFWRFRENLDTKSRAFSDLSYHINSRGFRGPEISQSDPDLRVLALGNSCTFGWGVRWEDTWTNQLQNILGDSLSDTQVEVINAGVPGYSSHQGRLYFETELIDLSPDIVLIMFGWNDHFKAGRGISDAEQQPPRNLILTVQNLLSRLHLYQFARKVVLSLSEEQKPERLDDIQGKRRVPLPAFAYNLTSIINTARANNIKPVLIIPPIASLANYYGAGPARSDFHTLHRSYQEKIIEVGRSQNVQVVDMQKAFDQHNDLFNDARRDPTHFNSRGHAVFAAEIVRHLLSTSVREHLTAD